MRALVLLFVLVGVDTLAQSERAFKVFFKEGKALFEQAAYEEALIKFKEAYRLDSTPKKIKTEGTFFEPYLPRHRIALCLEHIDILEADSWIEESLTALELNTLKKRQLIAAYRQDVERIQTLAKQKRQELETAYQLELASAQNLLEEQKFDEAEDAFQRLYEKDSSRPEASAGLNNVVFAKKAFIENKFLGIQMAIAQEKQSQARELLARVEKVDPSHPELDAYRSRIDEAFRRRETPPKVETIPPPKTDTEVVERVDSKNEGEKTISSVSVSEASANEKKIVVRNALLDCLVPYQHGNPDLALNKLEQISIEGVDAWASYHWLKSIFLLGQYHFSNGENATILENAREAMTRALELNGNFDPDPTLYPEYVLDLFREIKTKPIP